MNLLFATGTSGRRRIAHAYVLRGASVFRCEPFAGPDSGVVMRRARLPFAVQQRRLCREVQPALTRTPPYRCCGTRGAFPRFKGTQVKSGAFMLAAIRPGVSCLAGLWPETTDGRGAYPSFVRFVARRSLASRRFRQEHRFAVVDCVGKVRAQIFSVSINGAILRLNFPVHIPVWRRQRRAASDPSLCRRS